MEVASGPPRERYRCLREKVLALVRGYNEILSQLTPQERRLFSERLVFLDRKIGPGLSKLTWNAKAQLDVYLKETKRHCADASKLVSAFHGNKALLAKSCRQVHVSSRQGGSSPAAHASAHRGASAPAARLRARQGCSSPAAHASAHRGASATALSPQVHFSSSPGLLASLDDFYIVHSTSAQLAVIETTNDVYNPELFELVTPRSCLCWARAITANTLATTAPSWAMLFAKEASGVLIASECM